MAEGKVCGTGTWSNNPKPGDPDNNVILTATPAFGGIDVSWSYPEINPHGVAHTILYRSTNSDPATKVRHRVVTGDYFYDKTTTSTPIEYFYWIQIVSVNGTVGELIGPASATARPTISQMLDMLSGEIHDGVLATSLRQELSRIGTLDLRLSDEVAARVAALDGLGSALNGLRLDLEVLQTGIIDEKQLRQDGDALILDAVNAIAVKADDTAALIQTEQQVRADGDAALAAELSRVQSQIGEDIAAALTAYETAVTAQGARAALMQALQTEYKAHVATVLEDYETAVTAQEARATLMQALQTEYRAHVATVLEDYETVADAEAARASLRSVLQTAYESHVATALTQYETRSEAEAARASMRSQIEASAGDLVAGVEQTLSAYMADTDQTLTELGSLYTVKLTAPDAHGNQYLGGFGIHNDGTTVEAGFDVDRFWIGKQGAAPARFPFIIEGGEVFINEAVINKLTFNKLRAADGSVVVDSATGKMKAQYIKVDEIDVNTLGGNKANFVNANITALDVSKLTGNKANFVNANITALDVSKLTGAKADFVSANIKTAAIDTLKLAGNAVTYTASQTGSKVTAEDSGWETLCSLVFNHGYSSAITGLICIGGEYNTGRNTRGDEANARFRLLVGGSVVYTSSYISGIGVFLRYINTSLAAGNVTLTFQWDGNHVGHQDADRATFQNYFIVCTGAKR